MLSWGMNKSEKVAYKRVCDDCVTTFQMCDVLFFNQCFASGRLFIVLLLFGYYGDVAS
jgi:hypothetical protein